VARPVRCGLRLARLARTEICRRRRGLVGLAPHLGLGRFRLGVGSWFMGLGRRFYRRHRGPTVDRCTATDLRGTAADCRRNSVYSPATSCSRPATNCRCSLGAGGHFPAYWPAYWPAPWRCAAATNCGATVARNRRCSGTAPHHLRPALLRVLRRSSRPGLRDDRPRMVAWWLRDWQLSGRRSGCGDRSLWPCRDWIYRNPWGLAHSALPLGQHMAWWPLRRRS
jgi:hypothetical protein